MANMPWALHSIGDLTQDLLRSSTHLTPLKVAVIHPTDSYSIHGAIEAAREKLIDPILIGPREKIESVANQEKLDISSYKLIDTQHSTQAAEVGVAMADKCEVEALMKGKLHTAELMSVVVNKASNLRTGRRMSHVFILYVPNYNKPLFLTDTAINVMPGLVEKKDIVQNAVDLFVTLGLGLPKVAILSAVETIMPHIPSTIDAAALCKMADRNQITQCVIDGPLAYDNAVSQESAKVKGILSQVAGQADILVAPDVESGNMLYKQNRFLTGCDGAGIVMGARVPIILTSRASGPEGRLASSALALLYARKCATDPVHE
jgi:phosphotransacetylase